MNLRYKYNIIDVQFLEYFSHDMLHFNILIGRQGGLLGCENFNCFKCYILQKTQLVAVGFIKCANI